MRLYFKSVMSKSLAFVPALVFAVVCACTTTAKQTDSATAGAIATKPADTASTTPKQPDATAIPVANAVMCGSKKCNPGQVCCNASCGICTEPDGLCTTQVCDPPVPAANADCKTDADCRLFADYCTGCDCRVLTKTAKDPTCAGPGVRCLADPCRNKTAACVAGKCTARDAAPAAR